MWFSRVSLRDYNNTFPVIFKSHNSLQGMKQNCNLQMDFNRLQKMMLKIQRHFSGYYSYFHVQVIYFLCQFKYTLNIQFYVQNSANSILFSLFLQLTFHRLQPTEDTRETLESGEKRLCSGFMSPYQFIHTALFQNILQNKHFNKCIFLSLPSRDFYEVNMNAIKYQSEHYKLLPKVKQILGNRVRSLIPRLSTTCRIPHF